MKLLQPLFFSIVLSSSLAFADSGPQWTVPEEPNTPSANPSPAPSTAPAAQNPPTFSQGLDAWLERQRCLDKVRQKNLALNPTLTQACDTTYRKAVNP